MDLFTQKKLVSLDKLNESHQNTHHRKAHHSPAGVPIAACEYSRALFLTSSTKFKQKLLVICQRCK